jgi:hypothetical protein
MGLLALSTAATIALVLGAIVGLAFVGGLIALGLRGRERKAPDIPSGMRPGPADDALERRNFERTMGWGIVFTLVFALWLPVLFLREPAQNVDDEIELIARSAERGELWFALTSEENPTGFGCERCHGPAGEGGVVTPYTNPETGEMIMWQEPALNDVCARLPIESDDTTVGIRETIMEGRPGTPMPSWSVRFAGPMNDQQIQDLIMYLIELNEKVVPKEQNLCLNPSAGTEEGATPTPSPTAGATPTEGATGGETPAAEETTPGAP